MQALSFATTPGAIARGAPARKATDQIVVVEKPAGLAKIKDDTVQLAVWRRAAVPTFVVALADPAIAPARASS